MTGTGGKGVTAGQERVAQIRISEMTGKGGKVNEWVWGSGNVRERGRMRHNHFPIWGRLFLPKSLQINDLTTSTLYGYGLVKIDLVKERCFRDLHCHCYNNKHVITALVNAR